jgi:Tfp pilus assembly protein PilO
MPQGNQSIKQLMINKANGTIVLVTSIAAFVVIFCLVASFTLIGQLSYQNRVIGKKKVALAQLQKDITNVESLQNSYQGFADAPQNILGGNPQGTGPLDGQNAKIVLDALPSKYDFPALATSLETLLSKQGVEIQSITGTDDELTQSAASTSSAPKPIEMPFEVTAAGDYNTVRGLIDTFQRSIRPVQVQTLELAAGSEGGLSITVDAKTYYQPEKTLSIRTETVK